MSEYLKDAEKITVPVTGEPVSIWSGELKNIIYAIDDKINRSRVAHSVGKSHWV